MVNETNTYNLLLKSKTSFPLKIYNYISINYLCGEHVYMINLEEKKKFFDYQELVLNKFGIDVKRIEAVNGKCSQYDCLWNKIQRTEWSDLEKKLGRRVLTRGSLGYLLTMQKIFESNLGDYVCIMDDDILVKKNTTLGLISEYLVKFSNFNILKFGSSQWSFEDIKILEGYYYPNNMSNGSFFNIYKKTTYSKLLGKIKELNCPFDTIPLHQFINNKSFVIYPNIIIAKLDNVSDISGRIRTHEYDRFKWDSSLYINNSFISQKYYENIHWRPANMTHYLIGIVTYSRFDYLKKCLESIERTIKKDYFFTIYISLGLCIQKQIKEKNITFVRNLFNGHTNVNLIINLSHLHYVNHLSNHILTYSKNIKYDFGFILNDDIILKNGWYEQYHNKSLKFNIKHLCYLKNSKNTTYDRGLKHNGSVLNANGVLLTFTSDVVKNVGMFKTKEFKVRGAVSRRVVIAVL
jgi:GR25 family glycosyltransferase involved in LPS biosynthesis